MFHCLIVTALAIALSPVASADESASWRYTPSPMFGYDPSLGIMIGGALFTYPSDRRGWHTSTQALLSTGGLLQLTANGNIPAVKGALGFGSDLLIAKSMQSYFGEGGRTNAADIRHVFANEFLFNPHVEYAVGGDIYARLFAQIHARHETRVTDRENNLLNEVGVGRPDEATAGIGLSFRHDTRDSVFSSTRGTFSELRLLTLPSGLSSLAGQDSVAQCTALTSGFLPLGDAWVLAVRAQVGTSFGHPTYLYRYTEGGASSLRGYYGNRFRGDHFYGAQFELRFPIFRKISGVTFADLGDVADRKVSDFTAPKLGWGMGLRFGLPPEGKVKLRLDLGWGKDQSTLFVNFNEAF